MKMSYLSLIKNDEIICLTNLTLNMFKTTDSVNVTKILNSEGNKCVFNELWMLK